jgi:RimJ/RimL family protein N-acetyltransferase
LNIQLATLEDLDKFFSYINDHLADNGKDGHSLFQPLSRSECHVNEGLETRVREGIQKPIDKLGWRRLWIAVDDESRIVGHIDIRSHMEANTRHRALLGMGVDRSVRKQGLGKKLIGEMIAWVKQSTSIEYIDLWVLSNNQVAQKLYLGTHFQKRGEIDDMFRIDGNSVASTLMSRRVYI